MRRPNRWSSNIRWALALVLVAATLALLPACGEEDKTLTVYSGRSSTLVQPLLETYAKEKGIQIQVRYMGSSAVASLILEEGESTPADVVFLQDPGSLGALAQAGLLKELPDGILDEVDGKFRSPQGHWVGTSGRARTIVYNTAAINPATDLPASIFGFTAPEWKGRVGWAPPNGSFQAFVTALRLTEGEDVARKWLEDMIANDVQPYLNNVSIVAAAARGEVDVGFVNHYYLQRFLEEEGPGFGARNHFLGGGDPGALILVAGVGILDPSDNTDAAEDFIEYLLSESAQQYFAEETKEYPVAGGVAPEGDVPPLESLDSPDVDLGNLSDLQGTLALLRDVGLIP